MKRSNLVILEGPDGAGKTTLAKELVTAFGGKYHHESAPQPGDDLLVKYAQTLNEFVVNPDVVIFDRLYLGERIYGPVFRGIDLLGGEGEKLMRRLVNASAAAEIICLPPWDVTLRNWFERRDKEMLKDTTQLKMVYDRYEAYSGQPEFFTYDYTQPDALQKAVEFIIQMKPSLPPYVIGSPNARILVVGEVANHESLDLPFFALGNSSHYLNSAIADAALFESELAFVNCKMLTGHFLDLVPLVAAIPSLQAIVALGKVAEKQAAGTVKVLKDSYLQLFSVPHPAYWKRFHSDKREQYVRLFKDICNAVCEIH